MTMVVIDGLWDS